MTFEDRIKQKYGERRFISIHVGSCEKGGVKHSVSLSVHTTDNGSSARILKTEIDLATGLDRSHDLEVPIDSILQEDTAQGVLSVLAGTFLINKDIRPALIATHSRDIEDRIKAIME
jgi:hypothetical protein